MAEDGNDASHDTDDEADADVERVAEAVGVLYLESRGMNANSSPRPGPVYTSMSAMRAMRSNGVTGRGGGGGAGKKGKGGGAGVHEHRSIIHTYKQKPALGKGREERARVISKQRTPSLSECSEESQGPVSVVHFILDQHKTARRRRERE